MDISGAILIFNDLFTQTRGEICPSFVLDHKVNYLTAFIKLDVSGSPMRPKYSTARVCDLSSCDVCDDVCYCECHIIRKAIDIEKPLSEYSIKLGNDPAFYSQLKEFASKKWSAYKERQLMNMIYHSKIELPKYDASGDLDGSYAQSAWDISMLKMKVENGLLNLEDFKTIPDWLKDIMSFEEVIVPISLNTVYLYNPTERAVIDMRTDKLFKIPISSI